jgi:DNA polymerase I-like protein with 3'-5' exonuclease and polymerase domains
MKVLVIDCETTTANKGHPFTQENKLCTIQYYTSDGISSILDIEYTEHPYGESIESLRKLIQESDLLVGFNIKFDLHWLRRYGIVEFQDKEIWDTQLADYIYSRQEHRTWSLDEVCDHWGVKGKTHDVEKWWDHGVDTPDIPWEVLSSYALNDVVITWNLFCAQIEKIAEKEKMYNLILIEGQDLLALEEIEHNGLRWNREAAYNMGSTVTAECDSIGVRINSFTVGSNIGRPISPTSNDDISALLYGGTVAWDEPEEYVYTYKDGRTKIKTRTVQKQATLPRMVKPLARTEVKKGGYYQVGEDVLLNLREFYDKRAKDLIKFILEFREKSKLVGTYLVGLSNKFDEMGWADGFMHGNLNQTVTRTGRLSSSNPNQQNMAGDVKEFIVTRF